MEQRKQDSKGEVESRGKEKGRYKEELGSWAWREELMGWRSRVRGWSLVIETETINQGRTKEGDRATVGRDKDPLVDWRAIWGNGGRNLFREVGHPTDQASPRAVREHILSRYVGPGSDRLVRHATHQYCFVAAFAGVCFLPPL